MSTPPSTTIPPSITCGYDGALYEPGEYEWGMVEPGETQGWTEQFVPCYVVEEVEPPAPQAVALPATGVGLELTVVALGLIAAGIAARLIGRRPAADTNM